MHFTQTIFYKACQHKIKGQVWNYLKNCSLSQETVKGYVSLFNSKKKKKKKKLKEKKHIDREDPKANRSLFELKNKLKDGFE